MHLWIPKHNVLLRHRMKTWTRIAHSIYGQGYGLAVIRILAELVI